MSYADKKFCFNCKLDIVQLITLKRNLSNCSVCKIAQYCGRDCQKQDFKNHKFLCTSYKRERDLGAKAKNILDNNGHDVSMSVLDEFYSKNANIYRCLKKVGMAYIIPNFYGYHPMDQSRQHPLEKGEKIDSPY